MAGILLLGSFSDGKAQGSSKAVAGATVTASARVLSPVEVRQLGVFVGEEESNVVSVSSEFSIAGRLPFVMAAHVQPVPVNNRLAYLGQLREAVPEVEVVVSSAVPVSRHSVDVPVRGVSALVTWFVAVAL